MRRPGARGSDAALAGFALVVAALLLVGSAGLPPPRFEPLGSAALPRILAGLLILFAGIILVGAWRRRETPDAEGEAPPSALRGLGAFGALVLYVAALDRLGVPFVPATVAFVTGMGALLAGLRWRSLLAFLAFGVVLALLIDAVFTRFLHVDLT